MRGRTAGVRRVRQLSESTPEPEAERTVGELPVMLTSAEVAEALQVSLSTLCHWRARGRGPRVVWLGPATPRYRREDVLAWLERIAS